MNLLLMIMEHKCMQIFYILLSFLLEILFAIIICSTFASNYRKWSVNFINSLLLNLADIFQNTKVQQKISSWAKILFYDAFIREFGWLFLSSHCELLMKKSYRNLKTESSISDFYNLINCQQYSNCIPKIFHLVHWKFILYIM